MILNNLCGDYLQSNVQVLTDSRLRLFPAVANGYGIALTIQG